MILSQPRLPHRVLALLAPVTLALGAGCLRDGQERALADLDVGMAASAGMRVEVAGGLAHVLAVVPGGPGEPGEIRLRASAPALTASLVPELGAAGEWIITVSNCVPDAVLAASVPIMPLPVASGTSAWPARVELPVVPMHSELPTVRHWRVDLSGLPALRADEPAGVEVRIEPPAADTTAPDEVWRFAVMGDIQTALPRVHEVFERMNQDPSLRFVVAVGDLVEAGNADEYDLLERQLATLAIPYYSTIGNHELYGDPGIWNQRFGRYNLHFRFKGAAFSAVDSGSASLDPLVYEWLDTWLDAAADDVHMFFTHYPPRDPVGVRDGAFRSASEAKKLLGRLARGNVDATFYGHIHSYYAFSNAGIPAYISGGGGALPERWDSVGRHYLAVDVSATGIERVSVVEID